MKSENEAIDLFSIVISGAIKSANWMIIVVVVLLVREPGSRAANLGKSMYALI